MGVAENIETVRRFYAAGPPEDDRERAAFAAAGVVWHVPGANPVSGEYRGGAAVFEELGQRMQPLDEWAIEVEQVMGNVDLVVGTVRVRARRGDTSVETKGAHVFRFDAAGRLLEAWGFTDDQVGLDAVFAAPAG